MSDSASYMGAVIVRNRPDCSTSSLSVTSRRSLVDMIHGLTITRVPGHPTSVMLRMTPGIVELYGRVVEGKYVGETVKYTMTLMPCEIGDGTTAYAPQEKIERSDGTPLDDVVGLVVSADAGGPLGMVVFKLLTAEEVVEQTRRQTAQEEDPAAGR